MYNSVTVFIATNVSVNCSQFYLTKDSLENRLMYVLKCTFFDDILPKNRVKRFHGKIIKKIANTRNDGCLTLAFTIDLIRRDKRVTTRHCGNTKIYVYVLQIPSKQKLISCVRIAVQRVATAVFKQSVFWRSSLTRKRRTQ